MYPLWQIALVSILPGLLWLWFFARQDSHEPEPKGLLLGLFGLGMFSVLLALCLELPWRGMLLASLQRHDLGRLALLSFAVIGLVEETAKLLVLYVTVQHLAEFDEPLDGIIYGVTVGLGFAALENLLYAAGRGLALGLFRALITSLAHAAFTGWLGYFLTIARFGRRPWLVPLGLAVAILLHGSYDFILLGATGLSALTSVVLVGAAMLFLFKKIRHFELLSPYRRSSPP